MLLDLHIHDSHEMEYRVQECLSFLKCTSLRCLSFCAIRKAHGPQLKIFFFLCSAVFRFSFFDAVERPNV